MKKLILSAALFGSVALLTACSFGSSEANLGNIGNDGYNPVDPFEPINEGQNPNDPSNPSNPNPEQPPPPRCDMGKTYTGFSGTELTVGRVDQDIGPERDRIKPYSAMAAEYNRALGNTPALLAQSASTFDNPPARWYVEPASSAVSIYTAYRIAFQGCLTLTSGTGAPAKYQTAPTNSTAAAECQAWATKFWSREPTQEEVDACVKVAMVDSMTEGTNPPQNTTAPRRWAYTCASVLTAAGFTTY